MSRQFNDTNKNDALSSTETTSSKQSHDLHHIGHKKDTLQTKQYWRNHNIAKHIIQQEQLKEGNTNEIKKNKSSDMIKYIQIFKRRSLIILRSLVDITLHPSHIPPLLQRFWISIKHEAKHYWSGTKLLAAEVRTAYKLVRKTTKGQSLTRRERRQLQRTSQDLMRIIPFSVFVIVPFMELLLPIALKLFPNLLPSTYQTASFREQQLKRELQARLSVAGFLQESMEALAKQQAKASDLSIKTSAEELLNILKLVREGQRVSTDSLTRVAALFDNEITLDSFSHYQLVLICKLLQIPVIGTDEMMRYAIDMKMRRIHRDDAVIARDGIESLEDEELRAACRARGMRDFGLTVEGYRRNLQQWLDLSLNKKIPDSLLLLSRALSISEQPSAEDIRIALSSISEQSLDEWIKTAGVSDNEQRLALIRKQNELIAQEEAEKERQENLRQSNKVVKETADRAAVGTEIDESMANNSESQSAESVADATTEKHDISTLMEAIVSMSQSSAVILERERLEEMIAKVEQDQRDEAEQALVKRLRPSIVPPSSDGKQQQHPIQTLDDLAKWNAFRHQNEQISGDENDDGTHATEELSTSTDDSDESNDADDSVSKLRANLLKQLKKLQARVTEIDAEIGNKFHLVHTDSLGRIEDAELQRALKQLTGASDELITQTIEQIKNLAKNEGQSHVQLTLDDIKRLAPLQQEKIQSKPK